MVNWIMKIDLRTIYFNLVTFVGVIIMAIGSISIVSVALKTYVFKSADKYPIYPMSMPSTDPGYMTMEEQKKQQDEQIEVQRQNELTSGVSMLLVGGIIYGLHYQQVIRPKRKSA